MLQVETRQGLQPLGDVEAHWRADTELFWGKEREA